MRIYIGIFVLVLSVAVTSGADDVKPVTDAASSSEATSKITTVPTEMPAVSTTGATKQTEMTTVTIPETTRQTTETSRQTTETSRQTTESTPVTTSATKVTTDATTSTGHMTTVAPTKMPSPVPGDWTVTGEDGITCIRARMAVQIIIETEELNITHNLSNESITNHSSCHPQRENDTQVLFLTDSGIGYFFALKLRFAKQDKQTFVRNITVQWSTGVGPINDQEISGKYFVASTDKSYLCNSVEPVKMDNATIQFSSVHLQAFGAKGNTGFAAAEDCEADEKMNDIIPIAIACALCALVVIILISYLVFRRRSRQRGYESM